MTEHRPRSGGRAHPINRRKIYLSGVALCALVCFCSTGLRLHHSKSSRQEEIGENIAILQAMEESPIPDLSVYEEKVIVRPELDEAREQQKILALTEFDDSEIRSWFQDGVLVGDSITKAAPGYGWLSEDQTASEIGVSTSTGGDLVQSVIDREDPPQVVILCFGMNDMEAYGSQVSLFIESYRARIQQAVNGLPNAAIYVNAIFPKGDAASGSFWQYREEYNTQLEALCEEEGVYFLDSSFILESMPELFDVDGIHPKSAFYPLWLTYLADMTGLSRDDAYESE